MFDLYNGPWVFSRSVTTHEWPILLSGRWDLGYTHQNYWSSESWDNNLLYFFLQEVLVVATVLSGAFIIMTRPFGCNCVQLLIPVVFFILSISSVLAGNKSLFKKRHNLLINIVCFDRWRVRQLHADRHVLDERRDSRKRWLLRSILAYDLLCPSSDPSRRCRIPWKTSLCSLIRIVSLGKHFRRIPS